MRNEAESFEFRVGKGLGEVLSCNEELGMWRYGLALEAVPGFSGLPAVVPDVRRFELPLGRPIWEGWRPSSTGRP